MASRSRKSKNKEASIEFIVGLAFIAIDRAKEWGDVKPNVLYEYGSWAIAFTLFFRAFWICPFTEKWRVIPKGGTIFLTAGVLVAASWQTFTEKYRVQHERPMPIIFPNQAQLSDGTNLFGKQIIVSNPSESEIHAITLFIESHGAPIDSVKSELSNPKPNEAPSGDPRVPFVATLNFANTNCEGRFVVFQALHPKEQRSLWIRGTVASNSYADVSVVQFLNTPPAIKYNTNGLWLWPIISSNNAFWKRTHTDNPMDLDLGIQMEYSNHIKIPSRP